MGPDIKVQQGTTVVAEQLDEFGDVVDAPVEGTSDPYAPNFEKVGEAYCFWLVCVRHAFLCMP